MRFKYENFIWKYLNVNLLLQLCETVLLRAQ